MIRGEVNSHREAVIPIEVHGVGDHKVTIEAVIDTGFNGYLTLPSKLIKQLKLLWRRAGRGQMADGSEILFDIYEATVDWCGSTRRVSVDEAGNVPLVGMSLLDSFELRIEGTIGGVVSIDALPK